MVVMVVEAAVRQRGHVLPEGAAFRRPRSWKLPPGSEFTILIFPGLRPHVLSA